MASLINSSTFGSLLQVVCAINLLPQPRENTPQPVKFSRRFQWTPFTWFIKSGNLGWVLLTRLLVVMVIIWIHWSYFNSFSSLLNQFCGKVEITCKHEPCVWRFIAEGRLLVLIFCKMQKKNSLVGCLILSFWKWGARARVQVLLTDADSNDSLHSSVSSALFSFVDFCTFNRVELVLYLLMMTMPYENTCASKLTWLVTFIVSYAILAGDKFKKILPTHERLSSVETCVAS